MIEGNKDFSLSKDDILAELEVFAQENAQLHDRISYLKEENDYLVETVMRLEKRIEMIYENKSNK